jgi:hypothetical protein
MLYTDRDLAKELSLGLQSARLVTDEHVFLVAVVDMLSLWSLSNNPHVVLFDRPALCA